MVTQPRIRQPLGAGRWMPEYTREIERAIVQTITENLTQVSGSFVLDDGGAAADGLFMLDDGGA